MTKIRLDLALVQIGLVSSRSQAESYIKLGNILVNKKVIKKPGLLVGHMDFNNIEINIKKQYVSRAALKLASVADDLKLNFKDKIVLDVGSSTGGFTDYALRHGALKVIAVENGTNQLHPTLLGNKKIELYEKTDIRDFSTGEKIDLVLIDVSFISIREILPTVKSLAPYALIVAMVKPQFEAHQSGLMHKGVIKNDKIRRQIFKDFEVWVKAHYVIKDKLDSHVSGAKGNQERFYLLV